MYYTYMLRCLDNSIYTGMTNDIEKRIEKHKKGKGDRKSTRLNSSHPTTSRMPSSA